MFSACFIGGVFLTILGTAGIWTDSLSPASQWKCWKSDIGRLVFNTLYYTILSTILYYTLCYILYEMIIISSSKILRAAKEQIVDKENFNSFLLLSVMLTGAHYVTLLSLKYLNYRAICSKAIICKYAYQMNNYLYIKSIIIICDVYKFIGHWKCKDNTKWQQQSIWKIPGNFFW